MRGILIFFNKYKPFRNSDVAITHAENLLAKSVIKMEEEFKQLLSSYSQPLEPDRVLACISASPWPSSDVRDSEHQSGNVQKAIYTPPILMPPRSLPFLHSLAKQVFQARHHRQLLKMYKDARSIALEQPLKKLGSEKLSKDKVQRL